MTNDIDNVEVVYHVLRDATADRWVVSQENTTFRREFDRKKDAEEFGKQLAKKARLGRMEVYKKNGNLDYKFTYNKDAAQTPD